MILAAIDSGIDLVAVALFDTALCPPRPLPADPNGFIRAMHGLYRTFTVATSPEDATVERCAEICRRLEEKMEGRPVDHALIEIPRNAYRSAKTAREGYSLNAVNEGLMLLNRGIGAIAAGMAGSAAQVLETRAFGSKKEHRRLEVNASLAAVGKPAVTNGDMADAVHIGLVWVTEYLRHPDVFTRNVFRGELYHTWTGAELARREAARKEEERAERAAARRKPRVARGSGRGGRR